MAGPSEHKRHLSIVDRILIWVNAAASFIAIGSVFFGFFVVKGRISSFEKNMQAIWLGRWDLKVALLEPKPKAIVTAKNIYLKISGKVVVFDKCHRPLPTETNIAVHLHRLGLELVALVRPHYERGLVWWVQTKPAVMSDGVFQGVVQVGATARQTSVVHYDLLVAIVGRGTLSLGQRLPNIPPALTYSRAITITRPF